MWSASITGKSLIGGVLFVSVSYTNGKDTVTEQIDMTGGEDGILEKKIQAKLDTLTASDNLATKIVVGAFTPVTPTISPNDSFFQNVQKLQQLKRAVDLGVINTSDKIYVDTLTTVQSSFDPALLYFF